MPFPPPVLDDRSYDDLIAELRARIAVYTPEWTDQSPGDPGITLLELVAFLGENLLYRFNQIPDATRAWLLRLLQVPLRPATPASGLVVATVDGTTSGDLPAGSVLKAGGVQFETEQDLAALPLASVAMAKIAGPAPTDPDLVAAAQAALDSIGGDGDPAYYVPVALPADPGAPGAAPVDLPSAVDGTLWVALLAPKESVDLDDLRRAGGPLDGQVLNLGVSLDAEVTSMFEVDPCDGLAPATTTPPQQIEWQLSVDDVDDEGRPVYRTIPVVSDTTGGLRHDGVVRLQLPALPGEVGVPEPEPDAVGAGDYPPQLDDPRPVLAWLRAYPAAGGPEIPRLRWVGVNAAEVRQAVTAAPEFMGTGTGQPDQLLAFAHAPVQADAAPVDVQVEEQGVWRSWTMVDSLAPYGPDDRVWVLDAEAGTARFGTTLTGHAPQAGERVRALSYRYGGGVAGNLPAGTSWQVDRAGPIGAVPVGGAPVKVTNPIATAGGAPAETLAEGMDRIPGEFRRHDRAVTSSDFAELAAATPGSEVGRAECLPLFHPPSQQLDAAGVVTVVVWPRADVVHPEAPAPDRGLLRRVCAHLDARRLVTTELYVVPPAYRTVAVSVAVVVKPGYSADAVRRWVELVVRQYLAPLPPYGPEGHGWPLGRQVFGPELQAAALQVEGVDYLAALDVAELSEDGTSWTPRDPVLLQPWEVVSLGSISVVAGTTPAPLGEPPAPPGTSGPVLPIPTREERC